MMESTTKPIATIAQNAMKNLEVADAPVNESTLYTDPIVAILAEKDRPQKEVICQRCPGAMWQTGLREVKCFCSQMRVFTWTSTDRAPITRCTGQVKMLAQLAAELAGKQ
jgi:hypothetical protein